MFLFLIVSVLNVKWIIHNALNVYLKIKIVYSPSWCCNDFLPSVEHNKIVSAVNINTKSVYLWMDKWISSNFIKSYVVVAWYSQGYIKISLGPRAMDYCRAPIIIII